MKLQGSKVACIYINSRILYVPSSLTCNKGKFYSPFHSPFCLSSPYPVQWLETPFTVTGSGQSQISSDINIEYKLDYVQSQISSDTNIEYKLDYVQSQVSSDTNIEYKLDYVQSQISSDTNIEYKLDNVQSQVPSDTNIEYKLDTVPCQEADKECVDVMSEVCSVLDQKSSVVWILL